VVCAPLLLLLFVQLLLLRLLLLLLLLLLWPAAGALEQGCNPQTPAMQNKQGANFVLLLGFLSSSFISFKSLSIDMLCVT
jgi:hypothetical protein